MYCTCHELFKTPLTLVALCVLYCECYYCCVQVRILHTFDHPNVVHFYEWYETDNHLWCIGELCTGGMLEDIIVQDGHLPEESIQDFGADLLAGLSYVHSMGVVLCDLNPAKVCICLAYSWVMGKLMVFCC